MNKIKNFFSKAQNKANALVINAKTALQNKSGEGYIDTAVKIIISALVSRNTIMVADLPCSSTAWREIFSNPFPL